jgi:hypothetical protein
VSGGQEMAGGLRFHAIACREARAFSVLISFAAAVALSAAARADLVIKQQVEGAQTGEMTIRIKDGKTRADLATPVSMITDAASGDTIVLQHAKKTFVRMPASETQRLAEQLLKAQAGAVPKLQATGQKQQVAGHDCELFTWSLGTMRMRFWVARDFPNAEAIQAQLDAMQNAGLAAVAAKLMPKAGHLPGVRLRTELDVQGQKVSYTITSIEETPVDAALFEIPAGYSEAPISLSPTPSPAP